MTDYAASWTRFDGNDWTAPASLLAAVSQRPALAPGTAPGTVACAAPAGGEDKTGLQYLTLDCAKWTWTTAADIGTSKTDAPPALAQSAKGLACAYKASGGKSVKWVELDTSSGQWGAEQDLITGDVTESGPALAYYQGSLICVYLDAASTVWWTRYNAATSAWTTAQKVRENTSAAGLSLTVCAGLLYCAHTQPSATSIAVMTFDGDDWSFDRLAPAAVPAVDTAPGITTYNGQVYCLGKGKGTEQVNVSAYDGRTWTLVEQLPKSYAAALQPSAAATSGCLIGVHCTTV